jgi:GxxExxY protein
MSRKTVYNRGVCKMRRRDRCREWPQKAQKHKKSRTMRNDQGMRALCDQIRQTAFDLNGYLRNGHLEKVNENGMAHRLRKIGLAVERQRALQVRDEDGAILGDYFADLFVENCLILELKACKALTSEHVAQVLGYLRASGQRDAMLINFRSSRLEIKKFVL